jgi:hypothetical protein
MLRVCPEFVPGMDKPEFKCWMLNSSTIHSVGLSDTPCFKGTCR